MLQIELRVNGCLIDHVNIMRTTAVPAASSTAFAYSVKHRTETATVVHEYEDGALKLAALALNALTDKPAARPEKEQDQHEDHP